MPTYDYICSACGFDIEVVHAVHGEGPSACPSCGGQMRKSFAAPAIHFKGSGWAKKDRGRSHRTGTKAATPKSEQAGATPEGGTSSGTSDSSADTSGSGAG